MRNVKVFLLDGERIDAELLMLEPRAPIMVLRVREEGMRKDYFIPMAQIRTLEVTGDLETPKEGI